MIRKMPKSKLNQRLLAVLMALLVELFLLVTGEATMAQAAPTTMVAGVTSEEALRLGEKMYRQGILPSGEAMQAMVKGDVPVDGKMFTCVSCHLRSGVGTKEGRIRTPPIDGTRLYSPVAKFRAVPIVGQAAQNMQQGEIFRPAYTDKTLAVAIETGVDPGGRKMNTEMPLYSLGERDMAIMVYYLKNLSVGPQPGVTDTTLRFATVITDEVPKEDREAMLGALQNYIHNWHLPTMMEKTLRAVSQRQEGAGRGLRTLALSVWELKGAPATWRPQLEEYYRKEPVFALLGGISTQDWSPIHRFCEDFKVPAIFPVTDFPVISKSDFYTLYLSKGLYQEGEAAARYLHGREGASKEQAVVQVFRDEPKGLVLSKAFRETWVGLGHKVPETMVLPGNDPLPADLWQRIDRMHKQAVVLLWLNEPDFPDLGPLAKGQGTPALIMASATLLGKRIYSLPDSVRQYVYLTYPLALPQESAGYRAHAAQQSLPDEKVPVSQREPALKMYSLFQTISGPLSRLRAFVYRDYFLELIEGTQDLATEPVMYPRLSFGQGQRYASKGCYVVQLTAGTKPTLVKRSEWVIH